MLSVILVFDLMLQRRYQLVQLHVFPREIYDACPNIHLQVRSELHSLIRAFGIGEWFIVRSLEQFLSRFIPV